MKSFRCFVIVCRDSVILQNKDMCFPTFHIFLVYIYSYLLHLMTAINKIEILNLDFYALAKYNEYL